MLGLQKGGGCAPFESATEHYFKFLTFCKIFTTVDSVISDIHGLLFFSIFWLEIAIWRPQCDILGLNRGQILKFDILNPKGTSLRDCTHFEPLYASKSVKRSDLWMCLRKKNKKVIGN